MKTSQYNVIKSDTKWAWIYNTFSSSFIKIEYPIWNAIVTNDLFKDRNPIVKTLTEQGILVEDDENELAKYKYFYNQRIFDQRRLHIDVIPTMQCNFACPYCFEEGYKNGPMMTDEVEDALIRFLTAQKERNLSIGWFGGEPMIGFERLLSISEKLDKEGIAFTSSMITNGSLFTEEKIRLLERLHLHTIQISMDGLAEEHDKRRCFKSGAPSFDLIVANITKILALTDIHLSVRVTIDKTNAYAYKEVCDFFYQKFPKDIEKRKLRLSCNYVRDRTDFAGSSSCYSGEEVFRMGMNYLRKELENPFFSFMPHPVGPCMYKSGGSYSIDPVGDIYKCWEHLGKTGYKVGNILSGNLSFKKLSEAAFGQDPFDDPKCRECAVLPICGGGCPIDRCKMKNTCSIYREHFENALPEIYETYRKKEK